MVRAQKKKKFIFVNCPMSIFKCTGEKRIKINIKLLKSIQFRQKTNIVTTELF